MLDASRPRVTRSSDDENSDECNFTCVSVGDCPFLFADERRALWLSPSSAWAVIWCPMHDKRHGSCCWGVVELTVTVIAAIHI